MDIQEIKQKNAYYEKLLKTVKDEKEILEKRKSKTERKLVGHLNF